MDIAVSWLSENALSLYGAIAGTLALAVSYFSYRHKVSIDSIQLTVSFEPHPHQQSNVRNMLSADEGTPWALTNRVEVYLVTVRNVGSIPAPLEDVGIVTDQGLRKHALATYYRGDEVAFCRISDSGMKALEPHSSNTYSVYLSRGETEFHATAGYAVDQTGKLWRSQGSAAVAAPGLGSASAHPFGRSDMPMLLRNILAVVAGIVVGSVVNMAIITFGPMLIAPPPGVDMTSAEGLARTVHLFEPRHYVTPFLAHALGTLVGALLAFLVAARHKAGFAWAIGVFFLCGGVLASFMIPAPAWFIAVDLVFAYLPMAWLGIWLGTRIAGTKAG